jgi:hypothetical protein
MPSVNLYPYNFLPLFLPLWPCSEHYIDFRYLTLLFGQFYRLLGRKKNIWAVLSGSEIQFLSDCVVDLLNFLAHVNSLCWTSILRPKRKEMAFFSPCGMYKFALNFWCKPHRFQKRASEWYRALVLVLNRLWRILCEAEYRKHLPRSHRGMEITRLEHPFVCLCYEVRRDCSLQCAHSTRN